MTLPQGSEVVHLAKGTPTSDCMRCGSVEFPVAFIVLPSEENLAIRLCCRCLAEAIEVSSGWKMVQVVLNYHGRSDAAARFRDPMKAWVKRRRQHSATHSRKYKKPKEETQHD